MNPTENDDERVQAFSHLLVANQRRIYRFTLILVHDRVTADDSRRNEVTHYIDGMSVGSSQLTTAPCKLRFGETEISNWGTPMKYSPQKIRHFNGQIDEITLFGDALTHEEIQSLYSKGRP